MYDSTKNITVSEGTKRIVGCKGKDDIIYTARIGALNIYREHSDSAPELIESIPTPFTTYYPMDIIYSNGALYITTAEQDMLYMFDIATKKFYMISLPFSEGSNNNNNAAKHYRPCVFKGFCFISEMKMMTINYKKFDKYKVGQKSNYLLIKTNSTHPYDWEYDERFVDVKDDGIHFHTGDMTFDLNAYDVENMIYVTRNINKSEYRKFMSIRCDKPKGEE